MAHARTAARTYGKSDPIDALAVAGRRCANPTCPPPGWTGPPASSGCWSNTART
jgi:hypothetical protein